MVQKLGYQQAGNEDAAFYGMGGGGFGDLLRCVRGCLCGDLDAGNIHRIA